MSNGLALAAATRGLCAKISEALADAGGLGLGARVSALRPNLLAATDTAVNAYLFQTTPNVALRNHDLPTRREGGELVQRPLLALDLHFLLTFTGDEAELVPQRLMGVVLPALYARPELSASELTQLVQANSPSYLDQADLAQQIERVRFSLGAMNLEELSKLWSVFFQTQYLLSVPLQASVLLLEAPLTATPRGVVRARGLFAGTPSAPRIDSLAPAFTPLRRQGAAATVQIHGHSFAGSATRLRFGALEVAASSVTDEALTAEVPSALRAGVHPLSVLVHHAFAQGSDTQVFALASRPAPLAILPRITSASPLALAAGKLTLSVEPHVGRRQTVPVLITPLAAGTVPRALAGTPPTPTPGEAIPESFETVQVTVPADLAAGRYAVEVEVDGMASGLALGVSDLPFVEVP